MADKPNDTPAISDQDKKASAWWSPVLEFAIHVLVGTCIFVIIFLPAALLNKLVHGLKAQGVDDWLLNFLIFGEVCLIVTDTVMYLVFLVKTAWRAVKSF